MSRAALITGVTGQDGSYLAELLLDKGYAVYGLRRRSSNDASGLARLERVLGRVTLLTGDVLDLASLEDAVDAALEGGPERLEVYNLAAQSDVGFSFSTPLYTAQTDAIGALNVLEAVQRRTARRAGLEVRLCQASTSEMFGASPPPQNEDTPFWPRSPYGASKAFAYWAVRNYREAYGLHACNAICFNHESERRGERFVTRKVTLGVARLATDPAAPPLELGNLDAKRDWEHAEDVVRAMWTILQLDRAEDFVVASGEQHSVREFVEAACAEAGLRLTWRGEGLEEEGVGEDGRVLVRRDPTLLRAAEVDSLCGDASRLRAVTDWRPRVSFPELVRRMVRHDLDARRRARKKPPVALLPHLGMGDMLVFRGLVGALVEEHERVAVVCARRYLDSITTLFGDLEGVRLVPVDEAHAISPRFGAPPARLRALEDMGYQVLALGDHTADAWRELDPQWAKALYRQAGRDPALIADGFALPSGRREQAAAMLAKVRAIVGDDDIVLVHDDDKRPLLLPALPPGCTAVHVDDPRISSDNLFDYVDLLREARHLHCLDSCFGLLADLGGLGTPLTVHLYARDPEAGLPYQRAGTRVQAALRHPPEGGARLHPGETRRASEACPV